MPLFKRKQDAQKRNTGKMLRVSTEKKFQIKKFKLYGNSVLKTNIEYRVFFD